MDSPTLQRVTLLVRDIAGLAPEDELMADTPLFEGGPWLDSVMMLGLLLDLEKEFGMELAADDLLATGALESCASLAHYIDAERQGE